MDVAAHQPAALAADAVVARVDAAGTLGAQVMDAVAARTGVLADAPADVQEAAVTLLHLQHEFQPQSLLDVSKLR